MNFKAKKDFSSVRLGNVSSGQIVELNESIGRKMVEGGLLEEYDTKVIKQAPKDKGPANSSASPAAPASTKNNAKKSGDGESKEETAK